MSVLKKNIEISILKPIEIYPKTCFLPCRNRFRFRNQRKCFICSSVRLSRLSVVQTKGQLQEEWLWDSGRELRKFAWLWDSSFANMFVYLEQTRLFYFQKHHENLMTTAIDKSRLSSSIALFSSLFIAKSQRSVELDRRSLLVIRHVIVICLFLNWAPFVYNECIRISRESWTYALSRRWQLSHLFCFG